MKVGFVILGVAILCSFLFVLGEIRLSACGFPQTAVPPGGPSFDGVGRSKVAAYGVGAFTTAHLVWTNCAAERRRAVSPWAGRDLWVGCLVSAWIGLVGRALILRAPFVLGSTGRLFSLGIFALVKQRTEPTISFLVLVGYSKF